MEELQQKLREEFNQFYQEENDVSKFAVNGLFSSVSQIIREEIEKENKRE